MFFLHCYLLTSKLKKRIFLIFFFFVVVDVVLLNTNREESASFVKTFKKLNPKELTEHS